MTNWWSITKRTRQGIVRFEVVDLRGIMPGRVFTNKREATAYAKTIRQHGVREAGR